MIKVRFLPAAEIELLKEVAYYSKTRTGTGVRFQAAVEAAVSRAATPPLAERRHSRKPEAFMARATSALPSNRDVPRDGRSGQGLTKQAFFDHACHAGGCFRAKALAPVTRVVRSDLVLRERARTVTVEFAPPSGQVAFAWGAVHLAVALPASSFVARAFNRELVSKANKKAEVLVDAQAAIADSTEAAILAAAFQPFFIEGRTHD